MKSNSDMMWSSAEEKLLLYLESLSFWTDERDVWWEEELVVETCDTYEWMNELRETKMMKKKKTS